MPSHSIKTEYLPEQRISRTESSPRKKTGNGFRIAANRSEPRETVTSPKAQSGTPEQVWIRERTLDELRTIIRAIQLGVTDDWELTDLVFYARHPELKGKPLTSDKKHLLDEWNSISALMVHPTLNEIKDVTGAIDLNELGNNTLEFLAAVENSSTNRIDAGSLRGYTTKYDNLIASAVEWCPGLSPAILKSLLAQESAFNPRVINTYGYAGIAQFGRPAAKEVGLHVGVAGSSSDERLDPAKAIPGAARLLNLKAKRLGSTAFAKYGQPTGVEFWKFVTAAYNGGEGTVSVAMGHAYRNGLTAARNQGLVGREAVSFARKYASNWENLKVGGMNSPLGRAASRYFPSIAIQKYHEIGNYPTQIVARASGNFR